MKTILTMLLAAWALPIYADGIPFDGDRVKGQKTTVLNLSSNQVLRIETHAKGTNQPAVVSIRLTKDQKQVLKKEAGFAPSTLDVWSLEAAKDTCTCELTNMGIRFDRGRIEVPHYLLNRDMSQLYDTPTKVTKKPEPTAGASGVPAAQP